MDPDRDPPARIPIRMIGYWAPPDHFPDPQLFVDPSWDLEERDGVIDHLRHGTPFQHMMGFSPCRLCGENNGSGEQTDGAYGWPTGLIHYVEDHDVRPPQEFVDHVLEYGEGYEPETSWWQQAHPPLRSASQPATYHVHFVPPDGPLWDALIEGRSWRRLIRRNADGTGRAGDIEHWRANGLTESVTQWLKRYPHWFGSVAEFNEVWDWHTSGDHPHLLERPERND